MTVNQSTQMFQTDAIMSCYSTATILIDAVTASRDGEGMKKYRNWLVDLTGIPTAAGCEDRVIAWVQRVLSRRSKIVCQRDQFGNLTIKRKGTRSSQPIYFVAHMDHPAFVVTEAKRSGQLRAQFRGGVAGRYFNGSKIMLHHGSTVPKRGSINCPPKGPGPDKTVHVDFSRPVEAEPGDILTWNIAAPRIRGDRLYAPACDNLAGLAAAICTFDALKNSKADVRLLLTRCEEVGLVGATGVAKTKLLPQRARVIVLENSKAFAESPLGNGPIVRVGDAVSIFDSDLTYRIGRIASAISKSDRSFRWQRKLMPGGVCEATAFATFGYATACLCLPLRNYHNMNERTGRITAESISISDYQNLIRLLVEAARKLDDKATAAPLKQLLATTFNHNRHFL